MRIGLFTDTYPPYINGVSTSVQMLKNSLEKKGHTVYVVTINTNSMTKYDYDEENHVIRIPGVPTGIYDYRVSKIYPIKVVNMIKSWKLDVIHCHSEFAVGIFSKIIARQFNIPLIHTYHTKYDDYTHYITRGHFTKPSKKIVEYLTKFYCDRVISELIVPTNKIYKMFKEDYKYEKNIHIIPTGIEVDRFFIENIDVKVLNELRKNIGLSKKDNVLLYVGRLAAEKNVEFILNNMVKIRKKVKNIKLLIVGDGPDKEKYENMSAELKIDDITTFTGKVPWEEIQYYYHLSNIFVTASTSETQGLTIIEAMAAGVVPLCITDEAFKSTVIDGVNGIFFNNDKEYVDTVIGLFKNNKRREELANQARIQSEHLSSSTYAENVLVVYERAIATKNKYKYGVLSKIVSKIKEK